MGSLWNRSGTVERFGADDLKAPGAKAFFFLGGTTTPMSVYQDAGESAAHTHPVVADANGRWPDIFVPYILSYDVRVTTAENVQLTFTQEIPNPDPIDLSVTIPSDERVQTGMIHAELLNGTRSGYVRLNGRTMGNGASGGTERANADTLALFTYLWNNLTDAIAPVSTGRGGSGAADFAANKTITLPNMQGRAFVGLDDMGDTAGGFFTGLTFALGDAVTAGSTTGSNSITLVANNLPLHTHTGTIGPESSHTHIVNSGSQATDAEVTDHTHTQQGSFVSGSPSTTLDHTHSYLDNTGTPQNATQAGGNPPGATFADVSRTTGSINSGNTTLDHTHTTTISGQTGGRSAAHVHGYSFNFASQSGSSHSHTFTGGNNTTTNVAFNNLGLTRLVTWFIKL